MKISERELLQYAIDNDMLDLSTLKTAKELNVRKEILDNHKWAISQFSDGSWRTYLPDKNGKRKQIRRKERKDLEDVVVEYYKQKENVPSIKEIFDAWNDRRLELKKIIPSTHARNKSAFKRHFTEVEDMKINEVSQVFIADYLEKEIAEKNLTSKAFSNLKTITKGLLRRAKREGYLDWNISDMFDNLDVSDRDFKKDTRKEEDCVYSEEEMKKMMKFLNENRDAYNLGIMLIFVTGIRVGELVALKHSDFTSNLSFCVSRTESRYNDSELHKEIVTVKDTPKTEAGRRTVVVPSEYEWLIKAIKALNPFSEYLLYRIDGKRMQTEDIRHRLYLNCSKIGMDKIKSPHKIRMTYGTILIDNNISEKIVERQMGHTDISTTKKYYYKDRKKTDEKINVISQITEFSRCGEM